MTNHLHMVARRDDREKTLTELLGRFKSFTSKEILKLIKENPQESRKEWLIYLFEYFAKSSKQYSDHHFWQYSNQPVEIYTPEVLYQKVDYSHYNPVRAGIVTVPETYLYSSACPDSPLKVLRI
jgi:putative transposase